MEKKPLGRNTITSLQLNLADRSNKSALKEQKFSIREEIFSIKSKGNYTKRKKPAGRTKPYSSAENTLMQSNVLWEDFLATPIHAKPRNRQYVSSDVLSSLLSCPVMNATDRCSEVHG